MTENQSDARAMLAEVHRFVTRERDSIRGHYGAGSSTYAGYANACDDILGILSGLSPYPGTPEPQGEPSDAQVEAVKDGVSRLAGMQLMHRYSSFGDPWWDALYRGIARVALRAIGGAR